MRRFLFPFYRAALRLLERLPDGRRAGRTMAAEERLRRLYPGKNCGVKEYYAERLAVVMAVLFWGTGLVFAVGCVMAAGGETGSLTVLSRPSYGQGSRETELLAVIDGEEASVPVQVTERVYTLEELQEVFGKIIAELEQTILGDNGSLEQVRKNLELPSSAGEGVTVEWSVSPSDLMDDRGVILREVEEDGEVAELRALLRCQGQEAEAVCYAHVYPPVRTERELLEIQLRDEMKAADERGRYEGEMTLPQEIEGKEILWRESGIETQTALLILVCLAAALLWMAQERKLKKQEEERRRQMMMDYPELLFKMAMLLGAGLTIKGSFVKISEDYRRRKKKKFRYVYEEMLLTCRDMENGCGEAVAYESFGRRCGESGYVKFGALLSQNLKKGAAGLRELLEQEAGDGLEERKCAARKAGEEAGTKLLFPMMIMLALVLVILIVPAVLSF